MTTDTDVKDRIAIIMAVARGMPPNSSDEERVAAVLKALPDATIAEYRDAGLELIAEGKAMMTEGLRDFEGDGEPN